MTPTPPLSTAVADLDLPPLPKAECLLPGVYAYRARHMESYARAAVVAALAAPASDIAAAPEQQDDELPISRSTYGSLEECEKEHARRAAAKSAEVSPPDGAMPELTDKRLAELYEEATTYGLSDDDVAGVRLFAKLIARETLAAQPAEGTARAEQNWYDAKGGERTAEGSAQVAKADLVDLLRNVRPNFNSAGSRTEVRAYEAMQARIASAIELLTNAPEVAAPERSDTPAREQALADAEQACKGAFTGNPDDSKHNGAVSLCILLIQKLKRDSAEGATS